MISFLEGRRACGILAHITSLPSPYGIGDIGPAAVGFLDYLAGANQRYWQILPTGPTNLIFDSSPYMSTSAFAGSPLLISPDLLYTAGLIDRTQLDSGSGFSAFATNYQAVTTYKLQLLGQAFARFSASADTAYERFVSNTGWLEDYALFMALKDAFHGMAWLEWPAELARRSRKALAQAQTKYRKYIDYYRFEQFIFHSQWAELKTQASDRNIKLLGDIPIYIGLDSADVWAHQELFELDAETLKPVRVSGVPPDYFSATGQRWGNPLYRWHARDAKTRDKLVSWWIERFKAVFNLVDVARIDHFRGFESYWAIPAHEETAVHGRWLKGPGAPFFKQVQAGLGRLDIIAEDLGDITPAVVRLRDRLGFPGMKVLQFAFDGNPKNNFLPHTYTSPCCVVYTGTHDNDTTVGWFLSDKLTDDLRRAVKHYANRNLHDDSAIHRDMIYLALSSSAALAILPLQDLLGFGGDCRMNRPGIPTGNWQWRCAPEFLTPDKAEWLREMTERFGR